MNKTESLNVSVTLTDTEKVDLGSRLTSSMLKKNDLVSEMKAFLKLKQADISQLDAEINKICTLLNSGKEFRLVDCELIVDLEKKERRWVRSDNQAIARTERITEKEMQPELQIPEPVQTLPELAMELDQQNKSGLPEVPFFEENMAELKESTVPPPDPEAEELRRKAKEQKRKSKKV